VAHTCNTSYSGGRVQESHSSKPVWAKISQDPISKISNTKAGRVAQVVEHLPRVVREGVGAGGRNEPSLVCTYE
jgi:hypothetical protein